jgi:phosphoglycolate phosphatase
MTQPVRALIFDFDGTLADSYEAITASVNHVRSLHGMGPLTEDQVRPHVGRGPFHLLTNTAPGVDPDAAVSAYRAHHPKVMREGTRLLPGVFDTVTHLHRAGKRLGVCSNKPVAFTRELLRHLGLGACFEVVLGPEDVPRMKPAPDMLLVALRRLSVPPAEAVYVGDMVVDIEAGRAAGVRVWVIATGSNGVEELKNARPDRVMNGLGELMSV